MEKILRFLLAKNRQFLRSVLFLLVIFIFEVLEPASAQVREEWVARYNRTGSDICGASALAVDAVGNVYVTGSCFDGGIKQDYITVKYDTNGNELWVAIYNGPRDGFDGASAIAVDSAGNVYVTGSSEGLLGAEPQFPDESTYGDIATIKYDANGNELWVARYNGPSNESDDAQALAVDATGNVYVTGFSRHYYNPNPEIGTDIVTIAYDTNGNELWIASYNGSSSGRRVNLPLALAVDATASVYVAGFSTGSVTGEDYITVKYDANGNELWVASYNGPANDYDRATALAVDATGNVYVTGTSTDSGTALDYATIKYDGSGNELWVARYNGPGNDGDGANALAVDATGNVYVTGISTGSGTALDYATIKYDGSGNELWVVRYNGPYSGDDHAAALALDTADNVYVTGRIAIGSICSDYATIKYDTNGNELWVVTYNGPGDCEDIAVALAVDAAGNAYVTGTTYTPGTQSDYATIKYVAAPSPPTPVSSGGGGGGCFISTII